MVVVVGGGRRCSEHVHAGVIHTVRKLCANSTRFASWAGGPISWRILRMQDGDVLRWRAACSTRQPQLPPAGVPTSGIGWTLLEGKQRARPPRGTNPSPRCARGRRDAAAVRHITLLVDGAGQQVA